MLSQQFIDEGTASGGKGKTIAIIGSDDESAKSGVEQARKTFQVEGYKVAYAEGAFSITTPTSDYTPFVQAIMTSNGGDPPDIAYLVASFNDVQGLAKGLRQAGFEGIIVNPTTYDPRIVKAAETLEVYTQWATPESAPDNPNMQKVVDSITKEDPSATLSLGTLAAYFAADMFVKALKAGGKNPTTDQHPEGGGEDDLPDQGRHRPDHLPGGVHPGHLVRAAGPQRRGGVLGRGALRLLPRRTCSEPAPSRRRRFLPRRPDRAGIPRDGGAGCP